MARTFNENGKGLYLATYGRLASSSGTSQGAISVWIKPASAIGDRQFYRFGSSSWDMPSLTLGNDTNIYVGFVPGGERRIVVASASWWQNDVWSHHYFDWADDGVSSIDSTTCERYIVNGVIIGTRGAGSLGLGGGYGDFLRVGSSLINTAAAMADIAELAVWSGRRLTNFEIGLLAKGYSAAYFPHMRKSYHRILGDTDPEPEYTGAPLLALPLVGLPAQATHPTIQMPTATRKAWAGWRPIGAGFGNARKHRGDVRLNRESPLAKKIVSCFPCYEGRGTPRDLVRGGRVPVLAGAWYSGAYGRNSRSWSYTAASTIDLGFTNGPYTVAGFGRVYTTVPLGNYSSMFERHAYVNESNNQGWQLVSYGSGVGANKWNFVVMNNNGESQYLLPGTSVLTANTDWLVVGTSDGITRRIYVNGRLENTTTNNPNPAAAVGLLGTAQNGGNTIHYWQAAWRRCLTLSEVQLLWRKKTTIGGLLEYPLALAPAAQHRHSTVSLSLSIGRKAPWL